MAPSILLGPALYFRGEQGDRWRLSALFVLDGETEPFDLRVDGVTLPVPPRHLARWRDRHVWRFDFAVPRGLRDTEVAYGFADGPNWTLTVPGRTGQPRIAYVSCNGVEREDRLAGLDQPRNARWSDLLARHGEQRFHLLLQGGDQLYADAVWREGPLLGGWRKRYAKGKAEGEFTQPMAEEAKDFYFANYMGGWGQPETAAVMAAIPSVMMWDDHDVFDGWGSHPEEELRHPVVQGVYGAARHHFSLFQLGSGLDSLPECVWGGPVGTFTQGFRIGEVGIFAPDLRSERTPAQVMSAATWSLLPEWLDRFKGCRHLLLMSSVPLLFADTAGLERAIRRLPVRTGFEDDLRDQWRSPAHAEEWRRFLSLLIDFSRRTGCRVTALSGEIHAGGRGLLRGGGVEMWQLIASGVVHPPPGRLPAFALERMAAWRDRPLDGYTLEMPPFPESGKRIIRQRNWLSLIFDNRGQIHARWAAEGTPEGYSQTI
ncbi:alkaline phosphatase family protein [Azospirillum sp. SYSU D00513]|uniref:alkaline phosphatase family protein n=1 Tax=Azospirillum sp. SYSU D00513 TaxID=2812561 RepID=UPI001A969150|nr:alkaline phosphatase family protein [Azospirillum sp. SYSU D00513]